MILLRRLASILRWVLHRNNAERDLHAELDAYVELSAAAKMRNGVEPSEARRQARMELGGIEQAKERVRTYRHGGLLDELGRDVRYAFRMFRRQPAFFSVIVLTLALGIGANTSIFSLIDALMWRWLPVGNPQELLQLTYQVPGSSDSADAFSYPMVRELAAHDEIFSTVTGCSGFPLITGTGGSVVRVSGAVVTGAYYQTLGLNAVAGRLLVPEDDRPGAPAVAVISYGYWERQFGRDPQIAGRTLDINSVLVTIAGVSPQGFVGTNVGFTADVTIPLNQLPYVSPQSVPLLGVGNYWLRVLVRTKPGVSIAQANAQVGVVWREMADRLIPPQLPAELRKQQKAAVLQLIPGGTGWTSLRGMYREPLFVLMSMVALVLLIACANIAGLLMSRATARQTEIGIRLAIGAGRPRIFRQLLIESMLLSMIGAAFGIVLAWLTGRSLLSLTVAGPFPALLDLTPNWHVLGFTMTMAVAAAILFSVFPAFQLTSAGPAVVRLESTRATRRQKRVLPYLVIAQVALTLVLLIAANLFVRTFRNLQTLDAGFNREGVFLVELEGRRTAVSEELVSLLQSVPGVASVSISTHTPLSGALWTEPAGPTGQPLPQRDSAIFVAVGPRFFATMQTALLAGREFTSADSAGAPLVAIVDETFARRHFPNTGAVGQRISARVRGKVGDLEIVGIAQNTKAAGLRRRPYPSVYVPYAQLTGNFPTTLNIRVSGSLVGVGSEVKRVLQPKLPDMPLEVRPLTAQVNAAMLRERMMATLAVGFGVLALLLACIGLYGVVAYGVVHRTKEIGIRMALGARRRSVIAMVLAGAAKLVLAGTLLGLPAAWATSRSIESMLFGLKPTDPRALGGAVLLLIFVSLLAAYMPALRASRVEPISALRHE